MNEALRFSKNCVNEIKVSESFSAKPYLCPAKVPTIGYGCTFYENGAKVTMSDKPITEERASELLLNLLNRVFLPIILKYVKVKLSQSNLDALGSLVFNIGGGAFSTSSVLRNINEGANKEKISASWEMWNKGGGKVLNGLVSRRKREIELFFKN